METVFFNGVTNTIGTQRLLDTDVEYTTTKVTFDSVILGSKTLTFGQDDATVDLDVWITATKDGTLSSQVGTGLNTIGTTTTMSQIVTAVVDTRSPGGDDVWVFAVNDVDIKDIYYAKSTDGGLSWNTPILWVDDFDYGEVKFLSATFNNETCDIMVTWLGNSTTPWKINTKVINTGNCNVCSGTLDCSIYTTQSTCTGCSQCFWTAPTYRSEVWHNSSTISYSGNLDSVNVTINFTATQTDVYSLQIYDWYSSSWDSVDCDSGTVLADTDRKSVV